MEIKKSLSADIEGTRNTHLFVGSIFGLAVLYACFEYTTREYVEKDTVFSAVSFNDDQDVIPITQQIFTMAPPPKMDIPKVAELLDIVENNMDIVEENIVSTESFDEPIQGPVSSAFGPVSRAPVMKMEEIDEDDVFECVEHGPEFPGGEKALMIWLSKNLKYPAVAAEQGIQGRVYVQFIVNKDGSIVDAKVSKSSDPLLDKEALRVVSSMPKWKPGKQNGKFVRVKYTLPVVFRLA